MSCEQLFTKEQYVYSTLINIGPQIRGYSTYFTRGQVRLGQHKTHNCIGPQADKFIFVETVLNPFSLRNMSTLKVDNIVSRKSRQYCLQFADNIV